MLTQNELFIKEQVLALVESDFSGEIYLEVWLQ